MPNSGLPPVSVVIPVIRPHKAARCEDALLSDPTSPPLEIVMEEDRDRIGCPRMVRKLVERATHDLICFLGDDTIPQPGMLRHACRAMAAFDGGWGLVGIDDNIRQAGQIKAAAHWLGHRTLLEFLNGEFFHTGYKHCFCDNELTIRAASMGRYVFCLDAKLYHDHPIVDDSADDADYRRVYSDAAYVADLQLYRARRRNKWTIPESL